MWGYRNSGIHTQAMFLGEREFSRGIKDDFSLFCDCLVTV